MNHKTIYLQRFLFLCYLAIAAILGALVGYVDMVEEDVQLPALIVILAAFLLGLAKPRWAWLGALIVGGCIPVAHAIAAVYAIYPPYETTWLPTIIVPLVVALVAALLGGGTHWMIARLWPMIRSTFEVSP
jgi:hypothetical protein